jgi:hypothetical protein
VEFPGAARSFHPIKLSDDNVFRGSVLFLNLGVRKVAKCANHKPGMWGRRLAWKAQMQQVYQVRQRHPKLSITMVFDV